MLDRLIFAGLYRFAPKVLGAMAIVKPETVIKWHRAGFRDLDGNRSTSDRGEPSQEGATAFHMAELKARAAKAKKTPATRTTQTSAYVRDAAVAEYVKRLAKGDCDLCDQQAPFENKQSEAYLECHHIVWLAKGGEDTIENTVALCPNCHRKMHVLNRKTDREKLTGRAASRDFSVAAIEATGSAAEAFKFLPDQ